MKCPNCGFENDGKFCVQCGTPLTAQQTEQKAEEQTTVSQDTNAPEQNSEQPQTNQANPQDFAQHYSSQPQGNEGAQGVNQTSYGQQFTNQKADYKGQQFSNAPNPNAPGQPKKSSGGKTAIIVVSIVCGVLLILAIIFGVVACNVFNSLSQNMPGIVSEIADIAENSINDYYDDSYDDSDDFTESDNPVAPANTFYDEASRLYYAESEEFDGWKIVDYEMDYDTTAAKIDIKVPSQIEGRDVVEIEGLYAYYDDAYATVTIPGTVKVIQNDAMGFVDIDELIIEEGVETIEPNAFFDTDLKKAHIPASVTMMDDCCIGLDDDGNPDDDFVLYGKKGSTAEKYAKDNHLKFVIE